MTSNAQKLGDLMLHGGDRGILFSDTNSNRISSVVSPHWARRYNYEGQTSASASSANGVYLGRSFNYQTNMESPYISVTLQGYISSGTWYWSWALWNGTQNHFVPLAVHDMPNYSQNAKTRTISTIQGNQTMNCVVPYFGHVHLMGSQSWATFDFRNESDGDAIYIYGAADNGSGQTWYSNSSQTIYIKEVLIGYGFVTGTQYDHVMHGY
tara:strand:- start:300 stop:929 length:630 start_codon:yes stop_codon:yes gene_type:complete